MNLILGVSRIFSYSINLSYPVRYISSEQITFYRTNLAAKDEACNGKINLLQQIYYIPEDYILLVF